MIASIAFRAGYPTKLRGIGTRRIELNPRLTVLYGPNGSGKTTILRALAAATGCAGGGWSIPPDEVGYDPRTRAGAGPSAAVEPPTHAEREVTVSPPPFEALVRWDGRPVFYQDCYADSEHSVLGTGYLEEHAHLRSSGERRIGLVNELIDFVEERFLTYRLPRDVRPTLLLDEVDNHIGIAAQSIFWDDIVARLCKKYQLVISTHSVFPILLQRDNNQRRDTIVMLEPDYGEICIAQLGRAIEYFNRGR